MRHPFLLGLLLFLYSASSYALTLGQVHVDSYINEPLKAVIEINDAKPSELATLKANLASKQEFERASLEWNAQTRAIQVQLDPNARAPRILVTTSVPVSEPFLSFVVEASWANGKMLRDYTVLLDPPTYGMKRSAPAEPIAPPAAEPRPAAVTPQVPAVSRPQMPEVSAPAPVRERETSTGTEPVTLRRTREGDNLWRLARRIKPANASMQQTVVGMLEANPHAFYGGNMHLLKSGQILTVPSAELIAAIPKRDAMQRITSHEEAWQAGTPIAPADPLMPGSLDDYAADSGAGFSDGGRVKLASATDAERRSSTQNGQGGGTASGSAESALLREQLASARKETDDLRMRLDKLEEQLTLSQELIALKNEQLAQMQTFYRRLNEEGMAEGEKLPEEIADATSPVSTDGQSGTDEKSQAQPSDEIIMAGDIVKPEGAIEVPQVATETPGTVANGETSQEAATQKEPVTQKPEPATEGKSDVSAVVASLMDDPAQLLDMDRMLVVMNSLPVTYQYASVGVVVLILLLLLSMILRSGRSDEPQPEKIETDQEPAAERRIISTAQTGAATSAGVKVTEEVIEDDDNRFDVDRFADDDDVETDSSETEKLSELEAVLNDFENRYNDTESDLSELEEDKEDTSFDFDDFEEIEAEPASSNEMVELDEPEFDLDDSDSTEEEVSLDDIAIRRDFEDIGNDDLLSDDGMQGEIHTSPVNDMGHVIDKVRASDADADDWDSNPVSAGKLAALSGSITTDQEAAPEDEFDDVIQSVTESDAVEEPVSAVETAAEDELLDFDIDDLLVSRKTDNLTDETVDFDDMESMNDTDMPSDESTQEDLNLIEFEIASPAEAETPEQTETAAAQSQTTNEIDEIVDEISETEILDDFDEEVYATEAIVDSADSDMADVFSEASNEDIDIIAGLGDEPEEAVQEEAEPESVGEAEEAAPDDVTTMIDLAKVFISMGDSEGAKEMLEEALEKGSEQQKGLIKELMSQLG